MLLAFWRLGCLRRDALILPHKKLVCWGGVGDLDSLRHVWHAYRDTARKLGIPAECVPDVPNSVASLTPGTLCIAADVWSNHLGPAVEGVQYVTHNLCAPHELIETVKPENHLAIQVYTDDCLAYESVKWDECRYYHGPGRTLFGPWGSNILAEEFYEPVFNPQAETASFVGAVWSGGGQGNAALMPRVETALSRRRLRLVHLTQISNAAMVEAMRSSRFVPAFAGEWQCEKGYLPCRIFNAIAVGQIPATNVPRFKTIFGDALPMGETVEETIDLVLSLTAKQWNERVRQLQSIAMRFTYRQNLESIARALEAGR